MAQRATITFRGEEREVEYEYEYDPSVGIDGVSEWWFPELDAAGHDALKITDSEDEQVAMTLTQANWERDDSDLYA